MAVRHNWKYLSIPAAVLIALMVLSPGIQCYQADRETISANHIAAHAPTLWKQTTQADFQLGTTMQTNLTMFPDSIVLDKARDIPSTVYAFTGGGTASFYQYSVSANAWTGAPDAPGPVGEGGKIASDGQRYIFAFQGGGSSAFWRFDVYTSMWTSLANTPGPVNSGSDLYFGGGKIYALQGGGSSAVWAYNILTETWTAVPITGTQHPMGPGACLAVAGSSIYVLRPDAPNFITVPKSGGAWTTLTAPMAAGPGADMYATTGNAIYVLFGGGTNLFSSYTINIKTWKTFTDTSAPINAGGGLAFQPTPAPAYLYALAGGSTTGFHGWAYTTTAPGPAWGTLAPIPEAVGAGGGLTYIYSSTGQYLANGLFISSVYDAGRSGEVLNALMWDVDVPNLVNQAISVQIRVSDTLEGLSSAPWTLLPAFPAVVPGTSTYYADLSGISGQYVQYEVGMSTLDLTTTPTCYEVRLYHTGV